MKKLFLGLGGLLTALTLPLTPAYAVKGPDVEAIQQKVDVVASQQQSQSEKVAQALNQLSEVQRDFQSIKGQLESSKYLEKESSRVYQDLDMRVSAIEDKIDQMHQMMQEMLALKKAGNSAGSSEGLETTPSPTANNPSGETKNQEQKEFENLLSIFNAKDYHNAASGWLGFLKKYPESAYAGRAQYWLAESFYYLEDFAKSIQEFQVFIEKYPQDPRIKEAFYKQGMGFLRLKRSEQARLFFQKLVTDYPQSAEAYKATSRLKQMEGREQNSTASTASPAPAPATATSPDTTNPSVDASTGAPINRNP